MPLIIATMPPPRPPTVAWAEKAEVKIWPSTCRTAKEVHQADDRDHDDVDHVAMIGAIPLSDARDGTDAAET